MECKDMKMNDQKSDLQLFQMQQKQIEILSEEPKSPQKFSKRAELIDEWKNETDVIAETNYLYQDIIDEIYMADANEIIKD